MKLNAFRYLVPLTRPFASGAGTWASREGVLISLSVDGITAWGEAAPLPGVSSDSLGEVIHSLSQEGDKIRSFIQGRLDGNDSSPDKVTALPSLQFAIDTLMADLLSQRDREHLGDFLFNNARDQLSVNATLSSHDTGVTIEEVQRLWDEGFGTFKLKVGKQFDSEHELLRKLRVQLPEAKIRIDVNQSWTREEAEARLACLRGLNIEYCEEPVLNPDPVTLRRIMRYSDIPIALDESLNRRGSDGSAGLWMESTPAEVAVIKPMIFGSFKNIFETYRHSVTHNYKVVFTTSLETGIGRMMTAFLASGLGSPQFASGLATGSLLRVDTWKEKDYIINGYFNLPDDYGLGQECRSGIKHLALSRLNI